MDHDCVWFYGLIFFSFFLKKYICRYEQGSRDFNLLYMWVVFSLCFIYVEIFHSFYCLKKQITIATILFFCVFLLYFFFFFAFCSGCHKKFFSYSFHITLSCTTTFIMFFFSAMLHTFFSLFTDRGDNGCWRQEGKINEHNLL